jgi:hypothetical protein
MRYDTKLSEVRAASILVVVLWVLKPCGDAAGYLRSGLHLVVVWIVTQFSDGERGIIPLSHLIRR